MPVLLKTEESKACKLSSAPVMNSTTMIQDGQHLLQAGIMVSLCIKARNLEEDGTTTSLGPRRLQIKQ